MSLVAIGECVYVTFMYMYVRDKETERGKDNDLTVVDNLIPQ